MAGQIECVRAIVANVALDLGVETLQARFGEEPIVDVGIAGGEVQIVAHHDLERFAQSATGNGLGPVSVEEVLGLLGSGLSGIAPLGTGVAYKACEQFGRCPSSAGRPQGSHGRWRRFEFTVEYLLTCAHCGTVRLTRLLPGSPGRTL